METTIRQADVPQLIALAEQLTANVGRMFGSITPTQLNWKPSPDEWSVGQCFDHLTITNRTYFPQLSQIRDGQYRPRLLERVPLLPGLWGPLLISSLSPETQRRMEAPAVFRPTQGAVDPQVLRGFLDTQRELIGFMRAIDPRAAARTVITSPAASFITYTLLDTYRIMLVHEQLHMLQACQVLEALEAAEETVS